MYSDGYYGESKQIKETTCLVTLSIKIGNETSFYPLKQLIHSYKTSVRNLKLSAHFFNPINGNELEELFKSCEKLENLMFSFQIIKQKVNIDDCLHSFQSK